MPITPTHLVYTVDSVKDAVNHLSPAGRELVSDDLAAYLDQVRPSIPLDAPVVLELTGPTLTTEQQQAVIRGLSAHYLIRIDEMNSVIRHCWIKTFWFALCLIVSSILIFLCNSSLNEVLVQYLYLPFWFFGYRVITFPLLELQPVRREKKRLQHFMSMKVVFTQHQATEDLSEFEDSSESFAALDPSILETYRGANHEKLSLSCVARGIDDLLHPASTPGRELLNPEMGTYLDQTEHFITRNTSVSLAVTGARFTPEQQASIQAAVNNFYALRGAEIKQASAALFRKIFVFIAGVAVTSIILFSIGAVVDVAFHELLLVVLWFFGDYLIEFILLENLVLHRQKATYERLQNLTLTYE